jgi:hypothetical protein
MQHCFKRRLAALLLGLALALGGVAAGQLAGQPMVVACGPGNCTGGGGG